MHSLGARGRGIRVAVWERGPDTTTNLAIAGTFDASGAMSTHSRLVHGVIRNTQANSPNGHAPGCTLFSANSYDLDALRWAVGNEPFTVINQSFHRDDEQTSSGLSFDDIYKDWVIMRPPYPTIVQAAGNSDDNDEYVNHKGFNSLAVANHNDDASAISSTSVFRNPASSHGDRETPEIGANGTGVAAVAATSDSGTSFASPAVAGIAALLQGENTLLRSWPEGCRAILLAGATRNVSDATWWRDVSSSVDAADGSGAVNALESYRIVQERRSRNSAATRRGWDIGVLDDDDFDRVGDSDFTYRVLIPDWILGPRHVKVALAWDSKVKEFSLFGITIPIASALEQDFDLKVYDSNGSLVAQSQSRTTATRSPSSTPAGARSTRSGSVGLGHRVDLVRHRVDRHRRHPRPAGPGGRDLRAAHHRAPGGQRLTSSARHPLSSQRMPRHLVVEQDALRNCCSPRASRRGRGAEESDPARRARVGSAEVGPFTARPRRHPVTRSRSRPQLRPCASRARTPRAAPGRRRRPRGR